MVERNPNPRKKELARTFAHRKSDVMKKAEELSVLCGGSMAVVIFEPDNDLPHVWPQFPETLNSTIDRFLNKNNSKATTTDSDEEKRSADDNCIDGLSLEELVDFLGYLDSKLNLANSSIDMLKNIHQVHDQELQMMMMMNNMVQYEGNHNPLPLNILGVLDCVYASGSNCNSSNLVGSDGGMMQMRK